MDPRFNFPSKNSNPRRGRKGKTKNREKGEENQGRRARDWNITSHLFLILLILHPKRLNYP